MDKYYDINDIKVILLNMGYELISDKYKNTKSKLTLKDKNNYYYTCYIRNLLEGKIPLWAYKTNPYSINNIKQYLLNKNINLELLTTEYYSAKQKLLLKDKENYLYEIQFDNLKQGKKPQKFEVNNSYTIDNIKNFIRINHARVELLSEKYTGSQDCLSFRCECGNIFYCNLNKFIGRKKFLCNICSLKEKGLKHRNDEDFVKSEFYKHNLIPLFKKYNGCEEPLLCQDKEGYKGFILYKSLKNVQEFNRFHQTNPYTIENIHNFIKNNNLSCRLVSDKYINSRIPLVFQCKCGNKYKSSWVNFRQSKRECCDSCSNKLSVGNEKINLILEKHNIKFEREYKIKDCRNYYPLPFDFVIFNKKSDIICLIEFQGIQHYEPIEWFGGKKSFQQQQKRDFIKEEYCRLNNIDLLKIPYWEETKIEDIIINKLLENNLILNTKSA